MKLKCCLRRNQNNKYADCCRSCTRGAQTTCSPWIKFYSVVGRTYGTCCNNSHVPFIKKYSLCWHAVSDMILPSVKRYAMSERYKLPSWFDPAALSKWPHHSFTVYPPINCHARQFSGVRMISHCHHFRWRNGRNWAAYLSLVQRDFDAVCPRFIQFSCTCWLYSDVNTNPVGFFEGTEATKLRQIVQIICSHVSLKMLSMVYSSTHIYWMQCLPTHQKVRYMCLCYLYENITLTDYSASKLPYFTFFALRWLIPSSPGHGH